MPKCVVCKEIVPPDMIDEQMDPEVMGRVCHFCKSGQNVIFGHDGTAYIKQEVIYDYKKFIDDLAEKQNVKDKLNELTVQTAVKRMSFTEAFKKGN